MANPLIINLNCNIADTPDEEGVTELLQKIISKKLQDTKKVKETQKDHIRPAVKLTAGAV